MPLRPPASWGQTRGVGSPLSAGHCHLHGPRALLEGDPPPPPPPAQAVAHPQAPLVLALPASWQCGFTITGPFCQHLPHIVLGGRSGVGRLPAQPWVVRARAGVVPICCSILWTPTRVWVLFPRSRYCPVIVPGPSQVLGQCIVHRGHSHSP